MEHESPELLEVAAMLEQRRARLTDAELGHIHRRVTASRPAAPARRSAAMRSRAAITSMLAAGFVMTGGGAALGVSALSETHSARAAQYGLTGSSASPSAIVGSAAGTTASGSGTAGQGETVAGSAGTLGASAQAAGAPGGRATGSRETEVLTPAPVQPARQLESGESELPFTGYLAGFVLLAGLATLAAGLTLRRGTRHVPLQP